MPLIKLTPKQRKGESAVPTTLRITVLDILQVGRRDTTVYQRSTPHGVNGYRRHDKHKGKHLE